MGKENWAIETIKQVVNAENNTTLKLTIIKQIIESIKL
jgi:hypothetical protein